MMHAQFLKKPMRTITAAAMASLMLSTSAFALEGKAVLDFYIAKAAENGVKIEFSSAEETANDSVVLNDVSFSDGSRPAVNIKSMRFDQLNMGDDNRITIGSMEITGVAGPTSNGGTVGIGSIVLKDADIPADPEKAVMSDNIAKSRVIFSNFTIKDLAVKDKQANVSIASAGLIDANIPFQWDYDPAASNSTPPMTLGGVEISGTSAKTPAGDFTMENFVLGKMRVPTSMPRDVFEWIKLYSNINIANMGFTMGGKKVAAVETMDLKNEGDEASGKFTSTSVINGIFVDLAAIPDPQFNAVRQQLGYDTLNGSMDGIGSWNANTGRAEISDMNLKFKNVGSLAMAYAITGYTAELAQKIQEIQMKAAGSGNPQAAMMQIMPIMSEIKLESFSFKFADDSLTGRVLKFQAAQMGQSPEALAGAAPMFVQMGMQGLNMPGFSEMVSKAVGAFLSNPGNLSVKIAPPAPVAISEIVGAGMAAPQTIPELLNVQVTANQ